jgi:hypothetical protein
VATDRGLLHRLPGKGASFWTSLNADDEAIFLAPVIEDISTLSKILTTLATPRVSLPISRNAWLLQFALVA